MKNFRVTSVQNVPLGASVKLEELGEDEETKNWPVRELVRSLLSLAISTRPDIANTVRTVVRYCSALNTIH